MAQAPDRRAQIANAAAELFAEYGYEATTVRQIADRVGLLAGSLYHHFATKEEMLHAVMRSRIGLMVRDNLGITHLPANAEVRLLASAILRYRHYVEHWPFHAILLQEGRFFRRHPDFAYVVEAKAQAFGAQQATLREGMETGLFRAELDTYLVIGTIARLLSMAAAWFRSGDIISADKPSHYTLDVMLDFNLDCVLRLVRVPSRLAEPVPRAQCESLLSAAAGQG
jgi:AcrR family transcriptional regulator